MNLTSEKDSSSYEVIYSNAKDRTMRPDWIIPISINIFLIAVTLWILISLIHYGVKTRKWNGNHSSNLDKLNAGIIYTLMVVCAVLCLFRYIIDQVYMNLGFDKTEDALCEILADAGFISYALIVWSVYLFLWFRQKNFYTNNMLALKPNKATKFLSVSSIFLISISGLAYTLFFIIPDNYESSFEGCQYRSDIKFRIYYGVYAIIVLVLSQMMLLALFIYPLIKLKQRPKNKHSSNKNNNSKPKTTQLIQDENSNNKPVSKAKDISITSFQINQNSLSVKPPQKGVKRLMKKTLVLAFVSIVSDIITQMLSKYITLPNNNRRVTSVLFDIAAFLNLIFLVFSFVTYKRILISPLRRC